MKNPVGFFEIYVEEMARAKAFYEAVFDVKLTPLDSAPGMEMWIFPMLPDGYGSTGALVQMPGMEPGANSVVIYFHCLDCAVEAAKATQAGGKVVKERTSIGPHGFIALVMDTEGNLIGLHSCQ